MSSRGMRQACRRSQSAVASWAWLAAPNTTCMPARHDQLTFQQDKGHGHADQHAKLIDQHAAVRAVGQPPPQPITQRAACMR